MFPLGWTDIFHPSRERFLGLMREIVVRVGLVCVLLASSLGLRAQNRPLVVEEGSYSIHLLLHKIGTESYTVTEQGPGHLEMMTTSTSSDRGMKRTVTSKLEMDASFTPSLLEQRSSTGSSEDEWRTEVKNGAVSVRERGVDRTMRKPAVAFMGYGTMSASMQMMMVRYWKV